MPYWQIGGEGEGSWVPYPHEVAAGPSPAHVAPGGESWAPPTNYDWSGNYVAPPKSPYPEGFAPLFGQTPENYKLGYFAGGKGTGEDAYFLDWNDPRVGGYQELTLHNPTSPWDEQGGTRQYTWIPKNPNAPRAYDYDEGKSILQGLGSSVVDAAKYIVPKVATMYAGHNLASMLGNTFGTASTMGGWDPGSVGPSGSGGGGGLTQYASAGGIPDVTPIDFDPYSIGSSPYADMAFDYLPPDFSGIDFSNLPQVGGATSATSNVMQGWDPGSIGPAAPKAVPGSLGAAISDPWGTIKNLPLDKAVMGGLGLANLIGGSIANSNARKTAEQQSAAAQAAAAQRQALVDNPGGPTFAPMNRVQNPYAGDLTKYGFGPQHQFFQTSGPQRVGAPAVQTQPAPQLLQDTFAYGGEVEGYPGGGLSQMSRLAEGDGGGQDDKIPALLSDGEYVMDAETVSALGDGSTKHGAKKLDKMRERIRKHKRSGSTRTIAPKAKSAERYLGGA